MQLSSDKIEAIYREYRSQVANPANRINYRWVSESGVYDVCHEFLGNVYRIREFVYKGRICYIANKEWVEDLIQSQRLPDWMRAPWGTYPDLPPKPPKE